jgi:hypothetical protein
MRLMPEKNAQPVQRTRRWKRTAMMVLLVLLGGAIVNVAVAWAFARGAPLQRVHDRISEDDAQALWKELSKSDYMPPLAPRFAHLPHGEFCRSTFDQGVGYEAFTVVAVPISRGRTILEARYVTFVRAGWPLRCLAGEEWSRYPDPGPAYREVSLTPLSSYFGSPSYRALPYRPILAGFIINTIFYALLLWLLLFAPFAARRVLRRKRRLCEKCAYPVGVSPVCTECGAAVRRS